MCKKNRILPVIFFLGLITMIFLTACGGTSGSKKISSGPGAVFDDLEAGKVQGTVFSQSTGSIIKGAVVETYGHQAVTGDDGKYLIGPMPAGDYRLIARAPNFSAMVKEDVRVYAGRITENIDYRLNTQTASYSPDFSVIAIAPFLGTDGEIVTVYCTGCGTERGRVTFNGKDANIIDWNSQLDGRIVVQAPAEVETGPVKVIINNESSKETQPQLFIGSPVILSAEPQIAQGGQIIHINGRNFNPIDRFNRVFLKDNACVVTSVISSTRLQIQLPVNAATGLLRIRIEGNEYQLDGISDVVVTIKPELFHIAPKRSIAGVPLTLYGKNFGDNRNNVKVMFGAYTVQPASFLSFTDTRLSFPVPDNSIVPAGQTVQVKVKVNEAESNALSYTAYDSSNVTLSAYGIYNFNNVSNNRVLRLASLRPTDRIAFLSILSGDENQVLSGDFLYSFSGYMGGNFDLVPPLPTNIRASSRLKESDRAISLLTSLRSSAGSNSIRAAMVEPASTTMTFFVRDFTSADPWNSANDKIATATLKASGTMSLVYYDQSLTGFTDADALAISGRFDQIYATIATACWDGVSVPPEGDIDTQRRIVLFLTPILDEPQLAERIVAFFDRRDKNPAEVNSAGTEILYLNPASFKESRDDFYGGLAETLQFMMYYNQKEQYGEGSDWQKMGLSAFARQEVGLGYLQKNTRAVNQVSQYLQNADTVSLNNWPASPTYADYGMRYLFNQYLFDRCGGYNAIATLEEQSGESGWKHIDFYVVRPSVGYGVRDFFHEFCMALYCDNIGFQDGFPGYLKTPYQFSSIDLRGFVSGVDGLRGQSFGENPVNSRLMPIKGFGCSLIEYSQGNWGDLEVSIDSTPSAGDFRTYVIYFSAEQVAR